MMLLVPGLAMTLLAIFADLLYWDRERAWTFGSDQLMLAGLGIIASVFGIVVSRLCPMRLVQKIAKVILGASAAILTLFVTDIAFRVLDPFGLEYYPEASRYFNLMEKDGDFAYIHPSGLEGVFQGVHVTTNREGLRWREHSIEKPEGRRRLLVLGDSVVFGWGVEQEQIFPACLQRSLEETHGSWEVIAAGVGSWNTRTEFAWLRKRGLDYKPDIVLLNIVSNDVFSKEAAPGEVGRSASQESRIRQVVRASWRSIASRSYLAGFYQNYRVRTNARAAEDNAYAVDSWHWRDAELALKQIASLCNDNEVVLVAALPHSSDKNRPFFIRYESCLSELGIPYTNLPDVSMYRNSMVDGHPNSEGHRIMAEHIQTFLEPLLTSDPE